MSNAVRGALIIIFALFVSTVTASAGTFYIAANGSDANSGTSKSSPWQHAPGMPACSANCAAHTVVAGDKFIFRGGDTWHFGNSAATPYTGGNWDMHDFRGTPATCTDDSNQSGCIYVGVDQTWFAGNSWSRPVLTADNSPSTSLLSSCQYTIKTNSTGFINTMVWTAPYSIFDNFELTGLCGSLISGTRTGVDQTYLAPGSLGIAGTGMQFETNLYIHGWTATTTAGSGDNIIPVTILGGGLNSLQTIHHIVIDGSDSVPGASSWGNFPSFYRFYDNIIRYTTQGVGQWCHDIHDNVFEYFYAPIWPTHGNILECNLDATGDAPNQPQNTPNVFYNNILRHATTAFSLGGNVKLWLCPGKIPEYWFNNILYDLTAGNFWAVAGPPGYGCDNTGGQYMFNNTLVDGTQPCHLTGSNLTGGQYLHVFNEHLINTPWDGLGCDGRSSGSNISMDIATAKAQGYASDASKINTGQTPSTSCANENTKPCSPTAITNATVGIGVNHADYCKTLSSYTAEPGIAVTAANACKYGTTDGCTYQVSNHTVVCAAQTAIIRPLSAAWDSGAYQFTLSQGPQPPGTVTVSVQ